MKILDNEQFWAVLRDGLRFSDTRADVSSGRWTVADMRARAEHGLTECRAGLAEDGDQVLDRLFAPRGRDGALERSLRDGHGRRSREPTKPMSGTLTLLLATLLSPSAKTTSAARSAVASGLAATKAGADSLGDRGRGKLSRRRT